eukprot:174469_1
MADSFMQQPDRDIAPLLERLKSKNKWNLIGDYASNFEKHLIPINVNMQHLFRRCVMVIFHWFRNECNDLILPENIDIFIGIFYTLPRCGICGMFSNLWLNLADGFIGCGRKHWDGSGGKGCALVHYHNTNIDDINERKQYFPMVIKLGTISKYGADVFDYAKDRMIMDALFIENDNDENTFDKDQNKRNEYTPDYAICIEELQPLLAYWGIEMGTMYKFDETMEEIDVKNNVLFNLRMNI